MINLLRELIKEAQTIEKAKFEAAAELGMSADKLNFEILQMPRKKTLGLFGGSPARIRAYFEITPAMRATEYLLDILEKMDVKDAKITAREVENGCILDLSGDDLGFIIGRRGDTLDALQYIVGLVANRVDNAYYRVTLNIGNYREKREQSLGGLARKMAGQAARTGRKTSLEPMNPYERRIIHTVVQEIKGASSWSVGSEPNRHVVIGPSDDNQAKARPMKTNGPTRTNHNRKGDSRPVQGKAPDDGNTRPPLANNNATPPRPERPERPERPQRPQRPAREAGSDTAPRPERVVREFIPRSNPLPAADGSTPPSKTQSDKEAKSALYGRIDL